MLKTIANWIHCRLPKAIGGGHLRGKRISEVTHSDLSVEATMQCPRCKATWKRREKKRQLSLVAKSA